REHHLPPREQIVFEGNLPAVAAKNHLLAQLLMSPQWPTDQKSFTAWMGEAIAIKDPTAAIFRPQSGNNVLIIGQNEEGALGIMAMSMISLAAQHVPMGSGLSGKSAKFYIFDGSPVDSPNNGMLARLSENTPHPVRDVTWRDLSAALGEIHAD